MNKDNNKEKKVEKLKFIAQSTTALSLGISMVVAVLMGVGLGVFLKNITGMTELLFLGIFLGVSASILNVYKAYKQQVKDYEEQE